MTAVQKLKISFDVARCKFSVNEIKVIEKPWTWQLVFFKEVQIDWEFNGTMKTYKSDDGLVCVIDLKIFTSCYVEISSE